MTSLVAVSPHLDDAVLSYGGLLIETDAPHVVTVFAGAPSPEQERPFWDLVTRATSPLERWHERVAEDETAMSIVGATSTRLGLLDGQYRTGPHDHDEAVALLRPLLADADTVVVPAAIGRHQDHLGARDAGLAAAPATARVLLAADLPYALPYGWPPWVDGGDPVPYLDVAAWLSAEVAAAGLDESALTPVVRRLSPAVVDRKREAMAAYASQLPALDAQCGARLRDPAVLAFELCWT